MPKRPMVATILTVAALALLLSFKTPQVTGLAATGGGGAGSGAGSTIKSTYSGQVTGQSVDTPFGTVQVREEGVFITELGRRFVRNLVQPFDAYLKQLAATTKFSRTV